VPAFGPGPVVDSEGVTFRLVDPHRRLARVSLQQELGRVEPTALRRQRGGWVLRLVRPSVDGAPAVDRMEYLFEVEDHNGHVATITDPGNPHRAGGAFGDKSVVTFPEYRPPRWLDAVPVRATTHHASVTAPRLDAAIEATLWIPDGLPADSPAPLLVVHDGPEFDLVGRFTHYLGAQIATGAIPPLRAALLGPGDRNVWYSANPDYADALVADLRAAAEELAPSSIVVGVGVSLGALALLHAHVRHPGLFGALFLQSGSFFTPDLDPQEKRFAGFGAVTRFVASVTADAASPQPVPTAMTCGRIEENRANNVAMADALRGHGWPVSYADVADTHNYTAWRDALHPHLTELLQDIA
jgi:enterochelin esterase family protein